MHFEVKGVQNLNVLNAMKQAIADSGTKTPVVAHKKNGEPWLVTMLAADWLELVKESDRVVSLDLEADQAPHAEPNDSPECAPSDAPTHAPETPTHNTHSPVAERR